MQNPNPSQTTGDQLSDKVRAFPCVSCGAKLSFAPGTTRLKCAYCGAGNDIPQVDEQVEELDLQTWLGKLEAEHETHEREHIKCKNCGGEQTMPSQLFASACTFCGTPITSQSYAQRLIKPRSLVPFKVTKAQAQDKWRNWIRGLWLAPSALKKFAQSDAGIRGIYVPFWTFDARTFTRYSGERGDDRTETYTTTNSNGERVTQTRTVTDWTSVSGEVAHFHDDVLVPASDTATASGKLGGSFFSQGMRSWNSKEVVPYRDEYIAGFQAEAYSVSLKPAFSQGKEAIDATVQSLVRQDIGGDRQRIHSLNTQYSDLTFKHILMPLWLSAYLYSGKSYRFMVNGQTGEVVGESPKSAWKIFFLVLGILTLLFVLLVAFGGNQR